MYLISYRTPLCGSFFIFPANLTLNVSKILEIQKLQKMVKLIRSHLIFDRIQTYLSFATFSNSLFRGKQVDINRQ
jgi:hypothetical protein